MFNTYISGPQGGAIPLTHEQKMARAIREIRGYVDELVAEVKRLRGLNDDAYMRGYNDGRYGE
jgi:hypothetical protein